MAVVRTNEATSLRLRFRVADPQAGTYTVSSRTISQINPLAEDTPLLTFGTAFATNLQVDELTDVYREDQANLVNQS